MLHSPSADFISSSLVATWRPWLRMAIFRSKSDCSRLELTWEKIFAAAALSRARIFRELQKANQCFFAIATCQELLLGLALPPPLDRAPLAFALDLVGSVCSRTMQWLR